MGELIGRLVGQRAPGPAAGEDFLQTLLDARYSDGSAPDDEVITGLLLAIVFAGQHTSAVLSTWTGLLLLPAPRVPRAPALRASRGARLSPRDQSGRARPTRGPGAVHQGGRADASSPGRADAQGPARLRVRRLCRPSGRAGAGVAGDLPPPARGLPGRRSIRPRSIRSGAPGGSDGEVQPDRVRRWTASVHRIDVRLPADQGHLVDRCCSGSTSPRPSRHRRPTTPHSWSARDRRPGYATACAREERRGARPWRPSRT